MVSGAAVFLSYSRREFYCAESLADALTLRGIKVWFDVRAIKPGEDWAAAIAQGLESCSACVVVASQAMLVSSYVEHEWRSALAAGKPVYVVLFEAVQLPPELANRPVLDFRTQSERRIEQLVELIQSPESALHQTLRYRPDRLPLPIYPFDVWITALAALLPGLTILLLLLLILRDWIVVYPDGKIDSPVDWSALLLFVAGFGGVGLGLLRQGIQFLRRRGSYFGLRFPMPLSPLIIGIMVFFWTEITEYSLRKPALIAPQVAATGVLLLLVFNLYVFLWVSRRSPAVRRWLPTGEVPPRHGSKQGLYEPYLFGNPRNEVSRIFRLVYSTPDAGIAQQIRDGLQRAGHRELHDSMNGQADYNFLLLSSWTGQTPFDQLPTFNGRSVVVAVSRVNVPQDLPALMRHQWVDYRNQSRALLESLGSYLKKSETENLSWQNALPEALIKPVMPRRVTIFANLVRFGASIGLAILIINLQLATRFSGINNATFLLTSAGSIISVLFSIWLVGALADRAISFRRFLILEGLSLSLGLILQLINGAPIVFVITGTLLGLLTFRVLFFDALKRWLPNTITYETNSKRPYDVSGKLWQRNAFTVMTTTLGLCAVFIAILALFFSPGKRLASAEVVSGQLTFRSKRGGITDLYSMKGTTANVVQLTNDVETELFGVWSPDGTQLAYLTFSTEKRGMLLRVVNVDGSALRQFELPKLDNTQALAWSPDGSQIAVAIDIDGLLLEDYGDNIREIVIINADATGSLRYLTNAGEGYFNRLPAWSPDGTQIAYVNGKLRKNSMPYLSLMLGKVDETQAYNSKQRILAEGSSGYSQLQWSPDGTRLAYISQTDLILLNVATDEKLTIPSDTTSQLSIQDYAWSPDGYRLALTGRDAKHSLRVYIVNVDGTDLRMLVEKADSAPVAWSPDGTRIVYTYRGDLFSIGLMDTTPQALTNDRAQNEVMAWGK